ncbi:MAG: ABC transporter substrate-binding protein [Marinifilaceae bacterium]|jgi:iron complex transport system substrate-binding protein|nr:ABC transporter substrate-binding protein [Marinifilaceae bacterium]
MLERFSFCFVILFSLLSCNSNVKNKAESTTSNGVVDFSFESKIKYAKGFKINKISDNLKQLVVFNPWTKSDTLQIFYLTNNSNKININIDSSKIINIPIKSMAALSNSYFGILDKLNLTSSVSCISSANSVYNKNIKKQISENKTAEVGFSNSLNLEKLIMESPEITMVSGFRTKNAKEQSLEDMGMRVIYNIDWMEKSPLARAEWCKFIASLYGKERKADSLFNNIEADYLEIKSKISNKPTKPTVMSGSSYNGTWYVSAGQSYFGEILKDANADYYWHNETSAGAKALSFESILDIHKNSNVWLFSGTATNKAQFLSMNKDYHIFDAVKNNRVYCFTKRMDNTGANDWFETSIIQPNIVLKDIVKILYPSELPDYELYYYKKLE